MRTRIGNGNSACPAENASLNNHHVAQLDIGRHQFDSHVYRGHYSLRSYRQGLASFAFTDLDEMALRCITVCVSRDAVPTETLMREMECDHIIKSGVAGNDEVQHNNPCLHITHACSPEH